MMKIFRKRGKEDKRLIWHYRNELFNDEALRHIGAAEIKNRMQASSHSAFGRMVAIQAAFCLGYKSGRDEAKERAISYFKKGGAI